MARDNLLGRRAVLLLVYGGPDSLADVPEFLSGVRGRPPSPELVAHTVARYRAIGGRSPVLAITRHTAERLSEATDLPVFVAARHWRPRIEEVVSAMAASGVREALAICMAPHYSELSVGVYRQRVEEAAASCEGLHVEVVRSWHREPEYVAGLAEGVRGVLARMDPVLAASAVVLFSAHSLPRAGLPAGDPYQTQLEETAALVATAAGLPRERWRQAYQSASGPEAEWLGPSLEDMLTGLVDIGVRSVVVCPSGFIADQVEILYDIDIALAARARELGLLMERTPLLNDGARLVGALTGVVTRWMGEARV